MKNEEMFRKTILIEPYTKELLGKLFDNHRKKLCWIYSTRIWTGSDLINLCICEGIKVVLQELKVDEDEV